MLHKTFDEKYSQYYDLFNTGKDYKKECDFLEEIFKKYSLKPVKTILDLGCGTGKHDVQLSKRGYSVDGLDISANMIRMANLNKRDNMNFHVGDISDFSIGKKFDACISLFSSFGYLTQNNQIENALECIVKHLNPEGLFILDCWNGFGVLKDPPTKRVKEADFEQMRIIRKSYPKLNDSNHTCTIKFKIRVFNGESLLDNFVEVHNVRFFFQQELEEYFADVGVDLIGVHSQPDISSHVSDTDWNMWVVSKLKKY